jgi:RimJ/RimL family protein N-acetyltransferase
MVQYRVLEAGDEAALEVFLEGYADSSMILRSNRRAAGLVDRGELGQGTYFAECDGGRITSVAAHYWNGNLVLQAPTSCDRLMQYAAAHLARPITGLLGPWDQVVEARAALGLAAAPTTLAAREDLFALALSNLVVPDALAGGRVACRHARNDELDLLVQWFLDYSIEALAAKDTLETRESCRARIVRNLDQETLWVLTDEDRLVAMTGLGAVLPDCVQVGGVWTPPAHRRRGYARSVVAGSLLEAREQGATRATLFTASEPARRAYRAIGFNVVGDYGIVAFETARAAAL